MPYLLHLLNEFNYIFVSTCGEIEIINYQKTVFFFFFTIIRIYINGKI